MDVRLRHAHHRRPGQAGVRFATAVAHAPLTGPSHASILTGRTPLGHGFRNNSGFVLAPHGQHGCRGLPAGGLPHGRLRLRVPARSPLRIRSRVRDLRRSPAARERSPAHAVCGAERGCDDRRGAALARRRRERRPDGRALVSLGALLRPACALRAAGGDLAERFRATPYDGEIAFVDRQLGRLLPGARGPAARSSAPSCSSRPTMARASASTARRRTASSSTTRRIRVPWVMAGPGVAAGRVPRTVARSIDVLPTLLDYAGLPPRPGMSTDARCALPPTAVRWRTPRLRRVALPRAGAGMGAAPRLADGGIQVHRGPGPSCTT